MIVFHHNDPDGRCAAAIVRIHYGLYPNRITDGTGKMDFVELNYHTHEFREVLPDELVFIVDYSFPPEIMNKILSVTKNVTLIDHHASTPEKMEGYKGKYKAVVNCDGPEAGCSLTWKHIYGGAKMPKALQLIRDYDTWTHAMSPASTYFTTGLNLFDCHPDSTVWDDLLGFEEDPDYTVDDIVQIGRNCVEFRDSLAKTACDEFGFEAVWEDCKCFVLYCSTMRSSLCFKERIDQYDICIMVVPHGNGVTIRLYSNEVVDVSELAKKFGGGGHKGAGGYVCKEIPEEFLPGGKNNG